MGCSQFNKPLIFPAIIPKNRLSIITVTSSTLSATNLLSDAQTLNTQVSKPCLKFLLTPSFSSFLLDDLSSTGPFLRKLHNIRNFWLVFTALKTNFETQIHSVCIPNYTIKDGLVLFAVLVTATAGKWVLKVSSSPPFLTVNTDISQSEGLVLEAWSEFSGILLKIKKEKWLEKVEKYEKALKEFIGEREDEHYWKIKEGLKFGEEFIFEVKETFAGCCEFVERIEEMRGGIQEMADMVNRSMKKSASEIVHNVFKKIY